MKRGFVFVVTALMAGFVAGCGSSGDSGGGTGETVAITGTLSTGTIAGQTIKQTGAAAAGYTVVAIDNETNATYSATTSSDGTFTVDVPSGSTYMLSLVSNGSYVGPIVFDGSGSEVTTGIAPTAASALGDITVDSNSGYARTSEVPSSIADLTAVAISGVPVGSGNDGKDEQAGITNRDGYDEDKDGIPSLFDADENNDGIRNGILDDASGWTVSSDYIESVYMTSNIWAAHGILAGGEPPQDIAPEQIAMWLQVIPKEGQASSIASVACVDYPSAVGAAAKVRWSSSLGVAEGTFVEWSLWSDNSYRLFEKDDQTGWIVSLQPNVTMNVGDTFTIRVTYTDSTYEDFYIVLPVVFTDWPKALAYNDTEMPENAGTNDNPVALAGTALEIMFSEMRDEDDNIVEGMSYQLEYGESTCTGTPPVCNVPGGDSRATATCADGICTASITVPSGTTYYVVPVGEANNQRNGEELWFTAP